MYKPFLLFWPSLFASITIYVQDLKNTDLKKYFIRYIILEDTNE